MLKIKDKVKNGSLIGKIIEIKENTTLGTVYLVKYKISSIKRIFNRKLWSTESSLEKVGE